MKTKERQQTKFSNSISSGFENRKRAIADYLGRNFNQLPDKLKKIVALSTGIAISGICFWLIMGSFSKEHHINISIGRISQPEVDQPMISPDSIEFHEIKNFKLYLDSLKEHNERTYDSILVYHPGLHDSINNFLKSVK